MELKGAVAIVTGSSSGVGAATAKLLASKGCHVVINYAHSQGGAEATAEALAYGWENWDRLRHMDNPAGYLYRVARTKARSLGSSMPVLPEVSAARLPHVEPGLPKALQRLSEKQRTVVWLVHGLE